MIAVVRWTAVALFLVIMVLLSQADAPSATTGVLAATAFLLVLVVAWTCGAFRRDVWIGEAPESEPASRLDVLDGKGRR